MPHEDMAAGTSPPQQTQTEKTYTQADVDQIIGKVKARLSEKTQKGMDEFRNQIIEEFKAQNGLSDDVINNLAKRDEYKIELAKKDSEIRKLSLGMEDINKRYLEKEKAYFSMATKNLVGTVANKLDSNDPETVYLWLRDSMELDAESGNVVMKDGSSVEDAVKKLLHDKPHLRRGTIPTGGGGAPGGAGGASPKHDLTTTEGRAAYLRENGFSI